MVRQLSSIAPTRRTLLVGGYAGLAYPGAPPVTSDANDDNRADERWREWLDQLVRAANRCKSPAIRKGWVPDKKELGIASLRLRITQPYEFLVATLRPKGRWPSITVDAHISRPGELRWYEWIKGDFAGSAISYYKRIAEPLFICSGRPPLISPIPHVVAKQWTLQYRQRLLQLAEIAELSLPIPI